jgi:hypothetical protein
VCGFQISSENIAARNLSVLFTKYIVTYHSHSKVFLRALDPETSQSLCFMRRFGGAQKSGYLLTELVADEGDLTCLYIPFPGMPSSGTAIPVRVIITL